MSHLLNLGKRGKAQISFMVGRLKMSPWVMKIITALANEERASILFNLPRAVSVITVFGTQVSWLLVIWFLPSGTYCSGGGSLVASAQLLWPHGLAHQAPLSMGFPSKHTGVGCHFLLQGTFPTQGLNQPILYQLSHQERPSYSYAQHAQVTKSS